MSPHNCQKEETHYFKPFFSIFPTWNQGRADCSIPAPLFTIRISNAVSNELETAPRPISASMLCWQANLIWISIVIRKLLHIQNLKYFFLVENASDLLVFFGILSLFFDYDAFGPHYEKTPSWFPRNWKFHRGFLYFYLKRPSFVKQT